MLRVRLWEGVVVGVVDAIDEDNGFKRFKRFSGAVYPIAAANCTLLER